jgi:hypothetical protein
MIAEILAAYAKEEFSRTFHNRHLHVGASEIGQCARQTWYAKHGTDRPAEGFNGFATRGTVLERRWLEPALRAHFGDRLILSGDEQRSFIAEELRATPDGLLIELIPDQATALGLSADCSTCVIELKTADPRMSLDEPKPAHVLQVQVQLGLLRERTNHDPTHGLIVYLDCSDFSARTFVIKYDAAVYANAKVRARRILTAAAASDLPPEAYIAGGQECQMCPFRGPCLASRTTPPNGDSDVDTADVAAISQLAREAVRLDKIADEAATAARAQKELIREALRDLGTRRVYGDGVAISWSPVAGRKSIDIEAMLAAGINPELYQKTGQPSDRLVVKLVSPKAVAAE